MFHFFFFLPLSRAQERLSQEDIKFITFMEFYYIKKEKERVREFMLWLENSKFLDRFPANASVIISFISETYVRHSLFRNHLTKNTFSGRTLDAVKYALFIGGGHEILDEVFDINKGKNNRFSAVKSTIPIKSPDDLGWLWGEFHATGNIANIKNLIDVLDENERLNGDARADAIIRQAAASLLQKNSQHHEIVDRAIRAAALEKQGKSQVVLKSILDYNRKSYSPLKYQNGDFSADIVLADSSELAKFITPFHEIHQISVLEKTAPGKSILIKILFSGQVLNNDLEADVKFDLEIKEPSGVKKNVLTNAEAINQKIPARFRIFNSNTYAKIEFNPDSTRGKYTVISTVRDKIGNKTVEASREIELID